MKQAQRNNGLLPTSPPPIHISTLPNLLEGAQIVDETFGSSLQNSTQIDKWSFFLIAFNILFFINDFQTHFVLQLSSKNVLYPNSQASFLTSNPSFLVWC